MKKIKLLVMAVLLTSVFSIGAYAQTDEVSNEDFKIGNTILNSMTRSSSDPIIYVSNSISDSGSYIAMACQTFTSETCDNLKLSINIQKKVNGSWTTVSTKTYTEYNTDSIVKLPTYSGATSGYQYRLKTYHYATVNGSTYVEIGYSPEISFD